MRCLLALAVLCLLAAPTFAGTEAEGHDAVPASIAPEAERHAGHPSFGAPPLYTLASTEPVIDGVCSDADGTGLATCLVPPPFSDTDGDGEHDVTDLCPHTAADTPVDDAGCSQAQFCAAVAIRQWRDARFCRFVDWRNDETFRRPEDCRLSDTDRGFVCVSRGMH